MDFRQDEKAREIALRAWKVPECLHVPIAAVSEAAIATYIGAIEDERQNRAGLKALLVRIPPPPARDERLRIWELNGAPEFFSPLQVWVDIGLNGYRPAYRKLLPDRDITGLVLSHAMNRQTALSKGYRFVRITPVARGKTPAADSRKAGASLGTRPTHGNRKGSARAPSSNMPTSLT